MNLRFSTFDVDQSDLRGVSEVLGSMLIFGLVLAVLAIVQLSGVPAANEEVEFDHNQRVQNDFLEFQQAADVTATQGSARSVNVEAGTRYPNRFLLRNPPEAAGSVTTEVSGFSIENARAVDSEIAQFWTGSLREYDSSVVVFRPNYNVYDSAPETAYEHGVAYNRHPNGETTLMGTAEVIDGNRITLIAVNGSLSTASASALALESEPLSAPMQSVSVRDNPDVTGDNIILTLQTGMTQKAWSELLDDEPNNIDSWSLSGGELTIVLDEDVIYDMRLAKIGVGSGYTDEQPIYLANGAVAPRFVELGGNTISVEVRDQFNTVKPGVDVTYNLDDGQGYFIDSQGTNVGGTHVVTSDENGLAKVVFKPTGGTTATISATADFGYPGANPDDNEIIIFEDIAVIGGGGGDGGGDSEINPAASEAFELKSATLTQEKVGNKNNIGVAYVTFENKGDQVSIEAVRINSFVDNSQSASNKKHPDYAVINGTQVFVGGDYINSFATGFKIDYQPGEEKTYRMEFWDEDGNPFDVDEGDFFIYSIEFEDGSISRYFVVPDGQS